MPTDPKDNKAGDLAEIRDLQGRKNPKPTVTQRRNRWTKESDTAFLAREARESVNKVRLVNSSRKIFQEKKLGNLKTKADAWAAQEKADIESGAKKPPASRLETFMAERNKGLKTALVREVEPGRNRGKLADSIKERRASGRNLLHDFEPDPIDSKLMAAAETGEAQAFVGQMKPGVGARTAAHTLQSREFNYPPANQSKDLGRAVTNTIRREQAPGLLGSFTEPKGGSLAKLAKERAARGEPIAGLRDNSDGSRNFKSNALKKAGKIGGKLGGKLGVYGTLKSIVEGVDTLRKLKTGAYDLTPEGTATPKKGVIES